MTTNTAMKETDMTGHNMHDRVKAAEDIHINTYKHFDIILERGEGAYLYDVEGKEYLDFMCGYGVTSLGHCSPILQKAIRDQAEKLIICAASYMTEPRIKAAELLVNNCCQDAVFFCNSGTEAVEGALKFARKWAYKTKGPEANEIIYFENAFHGRSMGSASITQKRHTQPYYGPYLEGTKMAKFNDLESVKAVMSDKTAAVIFEPIQGEGGLFPGTKEFFEGLRELCNTYQVAMISDEIQTGMGRLGTVFAHSYFDYEPDIVTLAKGIGGGFPVGAVMAKKHIAQVIEPGDHGTTYGANPLACHVVHTVVSEIIKPEFLNHVKEMSDYLLTRLNEMKDRSNAIKDVRGHGLMIGIDTVYDIKKLMDALLENGLITSQVGKNTLRFIPPLTIGKKEADEALEKLEYVLKEGNL